MKLKFSSLFTRSARSETTSYQQFSSCIQSRQPGLDLEAFQSRQPN